MIDGLRKAETLVEQIFALRELGATSLGKEVFELLIAGALYSQLLLQRVDAVLVLEFDVAILIVLADCHCGLVNG